MSAPSKIVQIDSDGITVWVNGGDGYCLGRFGRMGIDVHCSPFQSADGKGECLFCTHGPVNAQDWETFKQQMKTCHDVTVTDQYKPDRFR